MSACFDRYVRLLWAHRPLGCLNCLNMVYKLLRATEMVGNVKKMIVQPTQVSAVPCCTTPEGTRHTVFSVKGITWNCAPPLAYEENCAATKISVSKGPTSWLNLSKVFKIHKVHTSQGLGRVASVLPISSDGNSNYLRKRQVNAL